MYRNVLSYLMETHLSNELNKDNTSSYPVVFQKSRAINRTLKNLSAEGG